MWPSSGEKVKSSCVFLFIPMAVGGINGGSNSASSSSGISAAKSSSLYVTQRGFCSCAAGALHFFGELPTELAPLFVSALVFSMSRECKKEQVGECLAFVLLILTATKTKNQMYKNPARIGQGVASLIILSSAGYSWGREAEKLWAEIWNLTHESWS